MRIAVVLACTALAMIGVPDRYEPAVLVAAVVTAWCGLSAWWTWRAPHHAVPARVVAAALVALPAVELTQPWTAIGAYNGWAFAVASITSISIQFELPTRPRLALLVTVVAAGSYVAGAAMVRPLADAALFGVRLLLDALLSRCVFLLIRSRARAADRGRERAAAQRRAAQVAAARRSTEREYLATLHDTASATLMMVSLGAGAPQGSWLPDRARRDLDAITTVPTPPGTRQGTVDLPVLLRQATAHPLVDVSWDVPDTLPLPARPALAISHGVREAVENVARHSGVTEAHLRVQRSAGAVEVTLADAGSGFDPATVGDHHHGTSESISGRMTDAGGTAVIESAPGHGTTVRWSWYD
ncbi:signal transduction histidine kinase [Prauserella sediminis]|uniref:Signal transduction histidine kinase n=1 Tax=Prauserella sediminis TaxID=577680 RepID=A0A839XTH7_9PSEU|nr:ATP-binding protein [Prauserella sediminis]MBB3666011.1 signal transduction histidine kinase [Prauserella sediminis]